MPPVAFSYIRFSHPSQADGDSLRRQTEAATVWSRRNHATLDMTTTLLDLGKSAFVKARRDPFEEDPMAAFIDQDDLVNPDRRALAGFQALIKRRRVPRGAFLIIENLDRLSRDDVVPATHLLTGILLAGVKIVQLKPVEQVLTDKSDGYQIMMAVMELSRGHGESALKSERLSKAWANKKARAREGHLVTRTLPAWVTVNDGKMELIPEKAEAVRTVFRLAADGYGHPRIVEKMNRDGIPSIGVGPWSRGYVGLILRDRRALGEYQPKKNGQPDGDPVLGYFPAAVREDEYQAARTAAAGRKTFRGRVGRPKVNVFAKMIREARSGCAYVLNGWNYRGERHYVLINTNSVEDNTVVRSFPYQFFERAVLSMLWKIAPADVLNDDQRPDRVAVIQSKVAEVKTQEAKLEIELLRLGSDVPALARALATLREQETALQADLEQARLQVRPLDDFWKEAAALTDQLDTAADPENVRVRLRVVFRRVVSGMVLLVCPRGKERFAALEMTLTCGEQRHYLLYYRPRHVGFGGDKPGHWAVRGWPVGKVTDLRKLEVIREAEDLFDGAVVPAILRGEPATDSTEFPVRSGIIDWPAARRPAPFSTQAGSE
jgi:DNA invertase Pin-like site-specific DNA recombinase